MACGLRTRTKWFGLYGIDTASEPVRRQFLDRVETRMARLT